MRKPRVSVQMTIQSLYEEYLKLTPENPLGYQRFNNRHNAWYTYNQILEIGKLPSRKIMNGSMPEPRVVQKTNNNREKYWKDYFKKQIEDERTTNTN